MAKRNHRSFSDALDDDSPPPVHFHSAPVEEIKRLRARVAALEGEREAVLAKCKEVLPAPVGSPVEAVQVLWDCVRQLTREKSNAWARVEALETAARAVVTPPKDRAYRGVVLDADAVDALDALLPDQIGESDDHAN